MAETKISYSHRKFNVLHKVCAYPKYSGFTLIELLFGLAIISILVTIAVPSFINFMETNRLEGVAQQLYYTLQYARTEALKRNTQFMFLSNQAQLGVMG